MTGCALVAEVAVDEDQRGSRLRQPINGGDHGHVAARRFMHQLLS
jgi:hypothetical protein